MKATNDSMTRKDREDLFQAAFDNFMKFQHQEYAEKMLAAANVDNLDLIYNGFQTTPRPFDDGFEVRFRKSNGIIHSPLYSEEYDENSYLSDRSMQDVLEFPDDLAEQVGDGVLVVELEVGAYIKGQK